MANRGVSAAAAMSPGERELIQIYRRLPRDLRRALLAWARLLLRM